MIPELPAYLNEYYYHLFRSNNFVKFGEIEVL